MLATLDWARVERLLSPHHTVYLMHAPKACRIKIGRTRGCVFARRATLRGQLRTPIFVMARLRARPSLEPYLHRHFQALHLDKEWFEDHPDLHALARRFNALDQERFGPWARHPDDVELGPWAEAAQG